MLMARNLHTSIRTSGAESDGFMNMSPVGTSARPTLGTGHWLLRRALSGGAHNRTFSADYVRSVAVPIVP
jgi:hypothetical protein